MRLSIAVIVALIAPTLAAQQPSVTPTALMLRGVVTTANDVPLPRVRVSVAGAAASELPALTDERGHFTMPAPATPSVRLTFTKGRYATVTADVQRTELTASPPRELRVRMSLGAAISGQIRDQSGGPVFEAQVYARPMGSTAAANQLIATTNDVGEFRFAGLPAGTYAISVRPPVRFTATQDAARRLAAAPGTPVSPSADTAGQTVTVGLGADIAGIDMAIEVPSELGDRGGTGTVPRSDASGSIHGRIVSVNGTAIAGAVVQAYRSDDSGYSQAVESDARGRYAIDRLPPGDYRVEAFRHGYIRPAQPQSMLEILLADRSPARRTVAVRSGQAAEALDVTLARGAAITGTIVDEFGEPMQGVAVSAFELRAVGARTRALRVSSARGARTDDRGRYRLYGMQPGTYVIQATAGAVSTGTTGYTPLFYPGTATIDLATPTMLGADALVSGIDLVLVLSRAHRIRGTVVDPQGAPTSDVSLTLTPSERSTSIQQEPVTARANADGTFAFNNVSPGEYVVQAMALGRTVRDAKTALARQFATALISIDRDEPAPLELKLSRGATLTGRVTYEGISAPTPASLTLLTVPGDVIAMPILGTSSTGYALMSDSTFEYRGVFGRSRLLAQPQQAEWYVKSITYRGEDLADSVFDYGSADTFDEIEIVVSAAGAVVTGRVTDDRAAPVRDYTVLLFPVDRTKWTFRSRWLKMGLATSEGTFRMPGVPPGDYWIVAADRIDGTDVAGDLQNSQLLDALTARAVRISLGEGQAQEMTLRLVRR
jgi:protocatechuate 3,4-dioxygenase beta subunit